MEKHNTVQCVFGCEGTGYYPTFDQIGEDTAWVECPLHHPEYRLTVDELAQLKSETDSLRIDELLDVLGNRTGITNRSFKS